AVEPFLPLLQDVRPLLLGGVRGLFMSVIFRRWKKRDNAETLKACPSAASAAFNSSNVLSGLAAISARMRLACASIACERRSPPCGFGVLSPGPGAGATQRIALDTATRKCAAASRRDMPPSTAATTRLRRSTERDVAIRFLLFLRHRLDR